MLWTEHERQRLTALISLHSLAACAKELGRSKSSVHSAIGRLRLNRPGVNAWSEQEIAALDRMWPLYSAGRIAKQLNRTRNAVIGKVHRRRHRDGVELKPKSTRPHQDELPRPKAIPPQSQRNGTEPMSKPQPPHAIRCPCQLVELDEFNCKWPFGDPHQEGFYFCGAFRADNASPYCPDHRRLAYDHRSRTNAPTPRY